MENDLFAFDFIVLIQVLIILGTSVLIGWVLSRGCESHKVKLILVFSAMIGAILSALFLIFYPEVVYCLYWLGGGKSV